MRRNHGETYPTTTALCTSITDLVVLLCSAIVMTAIVIHMMMLVGLKIQANAAAAKATYSLERGKSADGVGGASPVAELPLAESEACDDASSCLPSRKSLSLFVDQ